MPHDRRAAASCTVAFLARLVVPVLYLLVVGAGPVWYFRLEPLAAAAWLTVSVLAIPAAVAVAIVLRARRGRDRRR